jgi:hypothetical protein
MRFDIIGYERHSECQEMKKPVDLWTMKVKSEQIERKPKNRLL